MSIRWHATITYRTEAGSEDVHKPLEEIGDLESIVERGPHWDTIVRIEVLRVRHVTSADLTVEEAERLR